jgi:tetratricopeptide (TPR) repeat protein
MRTLSSFCVRSLVLTLVLVAFGGVADAQGRRGKKSKKPKAKSTATATLVLQSGKKRTNVRIREAKYTVIKFREKGRSGIQEIKADTVREIRYKSAPPTYSSGRSQLRGSRYDDAAASFTKALSAAEAGSGPWLYASYYLGRAKLLGKDFEAAAKAFKRVLDKAPEDFLVPAATYGLGEALTGSGEYSKASATFSKLDDGFGNYWRAQCQIGIGDAALAQKKGTPARKAYKMAESRGAAFPEIRQRALVGVGKSYVLSKSWSKALEEFERIITQAGADPVVAGNAWVGKGDCLMAQSKEKSGPKQKSLIKEALIAYQTCTVRYAGIPEAYPKALYQSASIYAKLGLANMAKLQRAELKSRCPSSSWAGKLKK